MNVTTITMPVEKAREKLKAYRTNVHRDSEAIYAEAARGYEELAKGTPLIMLSQAIQQGGFDEKMRPKIAVAAADRREVMFRWSRNEPVARFDSTKHKDGLNNARLNMRINMGRTQEHWVEAYALIPMVPADVRPATGQLKDWFILWEVDRWYERSQTARASRDPMLLKHIGGDLYAVLAHWDLTPLEMAILEARPVS
jgi:hypothetical protein